MAPGGTAPVEIYFDNNATTRPLPEVVEAVRRAQVDSFGNPSSVHQHGTRTRNALGRAREQVADFLHSKPELVIFTSGTTEANNIVLLNLLYGKFRGFRLVTTAVEHSSILQVAHFLQTSGIEVFVLPVNRDGLIDIDEFQAALLPGKTLASVQWANNETGVLQPIQELASIAKEQDVIFHSDAAQAVGKVEIDPSAAGVDLLSVSGHKIHGPLGVGSLVGTGVNRLQPIFFGGSQERSLRPGTENVPAIVGLGVALETRDSRFDEVKQRTCALRDSFETALLEEGLAAAVNGGMTMRLPNTSNIRFSGVDGEALSIRLDSVGVRCSQSSACTNQKPEPSYVLRAMGLSEEQAYASIRFGFSEMNTSEEIEFAFEVIRETHQKLLPFAVA